MNDPLNVLDQKLLFTNVNFVHVRSDDDFPNRDDVWMLRDQQSVNLPQRGDGESLLLPLHLQPLQSHDLFSLLVPGSVYHAVRALLHPVKALTNKQMKIFQS